MSTHQETCEVIKDCKQRIRPSRSNMLRLILPANPLGGLANPLGGLVYLPVRRYTGMSTHQETCEEIKDCKQFKEGEDAKMGGGKQCCSFEETEDGKEIKDWILGLAVTIFIGAAEVLSPTIELLQAGSNAMGLCVRGTLVVFQGRRCAMGFQGRGCAMGFGNSLPTHRWLKGQYVYPLGDILVCLPVRRYTFPLEPIAYQKKKMELRLKCMSFAKRKQHLSSSEQNRSL